MKSRSSNLKLIKCCHVVPRISRLRYVGRLKGRFRLIQFHFLV
jgi:hypothetical protein